MKINYKHLRFIVLGLAALLILMAVLSATHVLDLDQDFENELSTWIMIAGLAIFIWSRKLRQEEVDAEKAAEKAKLEESETVVISEKTGNELRSGDDVTP